MSSAMAMVASTTEVIEPPKEAAEPMAVKVKDPPAVKGARTINKNVVWSTLCYSDKDKAKFYD